MGRNRKKKHSSRRDGDDSAPESAVVSSQSTTKHQHHVEQTANRSMKVEQQDDSIPESSTQKNGSGKLISSLGSSSLSLNGGQRQIGAALNRGIPRPVLLYGAFSAVCLLIGVLPKLLFHTGITETDVTSDFINESIMPNLESTWARMMNATLSTNDKSKTSSSDRKARPGYKLSQLGATKKYPVVMVPGFTTSGLELWSGDECARKHFRQRLWGSVTMARTFFSDKECWRRHMALDPWTGMDPHNSSVRLRAAQGFEAADYFMATYWVFGKLIENLADVGYDGSSMILMSYDWRVAFPLLEERDGYLTKLRVMIEAFHETMGEKVVLVSHSMGTNLTLFFFAWVTRSKREGGGGGGKNWVEKHVHAFVNIAGPVLGTAKAVPALLSGEMKDTSVLLGTMGDAVEQFFGRKQRKDMFATWGSLWALLPKGGDAIWGVGADFGRNSAPKPGIESDVDVVDNIDDFEKDVSMAEIKPMISFTSVDEANMQENSCEVDDETWTENVTRTSSSSIMERVAASVNVSVDDILRFLRDWGSGYGPDLSAAKLHAFRSPNDRSKGKSTVEDWHNAAVTPLPLAPSMKMYCLYGTGLDSERAYFYKKEALKRPSEGDEQLTGSTTFADPPFILDTSVTDEDKSVKYGVISVDGDATVPLLSLGYMCVDGWMRKGNRKNELNPSNLKIITREYPHKSSFDLDDPIRAGPYSSDHVDILGNVNATLDVLKIATDFNISDVSQLIRSDIEAIARRINDHPLGGIRGRKSR